jgi:hypothetical protein
MKYLILQLDTNYVYGFAHSPVSANAVAESVPDAFVMGITFKTFNKRVFTEIQQKGYLSLNTYKLGPNYKKLIMVPPEEVPAGWLETQSIITARLELLNIMNIWYSQAATATNKYHWPDFLKHISGEVKKANLVTNTFGPKIQQYAETMGMTAMDAYIKLRDEISAEQQYQFELTLLLEKHKARIATVTSENQAIQVKQNLQRDLLSFCKDSLGTAVNGNKLFNKDTNDFLFS